MTWRLLAASAAAASLAAIALYTRRRRPAEVRRARHLAWLKAVGLTSVEASLAVSLALECGEAMLCTAGASARWKDEDGIDPCTATDECRRFMRPGTTDNDGIAG